MNDELRKCITGCLFATAALVGGASPAIAVDVPPAPRAAAPEVAARSAALANAAAMLTGALNPAQSLCNQGVGNGPEDNPCDPANSNQASGSNDETGGEPGNPGRKGGKGGNK